MKKFTTAITTLFILFLISLLTVYFIYKKNDVVYQKEVDIFDGASVKQIAELLENYGAVKNGDIFYYYIKINSLYSEKIKKKPYPVLFQQGKYHLKEGDFDSLIKTLNSGPEKTAQLSVTIPEGSSIEKMANIFEEKKVISRNDFLTYIQNEKNYEIYRAQYPWLPEIDERKHYLLEGYLHANTYNFPEKPTAKLIVDMMLEETNNWYFESIESAEALSMNFNKLITLASIVEAESKFKEDRPKVAQVFMNRIKKKMKLESDMTAAYANKEHKVFMYHNDIETESPYNTYHVGALPIGPINSPSEESFKAVTNPAGEQFKAIYFYARPNGQTFYAETWQEHEKNRLKFEHEWKELEKKQ